MKKTVLVIGVVCLAVLSSVVVFRSQKLETKETDTPRSFAECLSMNFPVMESYPRQCRAHGQVFVEDIGNILEKADLITLDNPHANTSIASPLTLSGKARGYWYFEASFPIEIQDSNGNILGQGIAQAQGEWMTEDFVPFEASVSFVPPSSAKGFIVLKKDNPSGDPAREDSLKVPVSFFP